MRSRYSLLCSHPTDFKAIDTDRVAVQAKPSGLYTPTGFGYESQARQPGPLTDLRKSLKCFDAGIIDTYILYNVLEV